MLDFDTLVLQRPCKDRPSLRLAVNKAIRSLPDLNLQAGSFDPFAALGLSAVRVENVNSACQMGGKPSGCQNATTMSPRWVYDSPDVLALFVSMNITEAGKVAERTVSRAFLKHFLPWLDRFMSSQGLWNV